MTDVQTQKLLETIVRSVDKCTKCRLHKWRTKAVPGTGSLTASIVFVGEAPGYHEDKQGLPFVGRAGQLLAQLLAENDIKRQEVWIGNILKCRPPKNRDPMVDEIRACDPYLEKQIETINPKTKPIRVSLVPNICVFSFCMGVIPSIPFFHLPMNSLNVISFPCLSFILCSPILM